MLFKPDRPGREEERANTLFFLLLKRRRTGVSAAAKRGSFSPTYFGFGVAADRKARRRVRDREGGKNSSKLPETVRMCECGVYRISMDQFVPR